MHIAKSFVAATLTVFAGFACAQTTVAPNPDPAKIGVTQSTAVDAENKAVPRSDTGTLVRTGKARMAASAATSTGTTSATATSTGVATAPVNDGIDTAQPTAAGARTRHARN